MRSRRTGLAMVSRLIVTPIAGAKEPSVRKHADDHGRLQAQGGAQAVNLETCTLDNGLQVVVLPLPGLPQVSHMIWYRVGGADDPAGKSGLASLVEHATFRSTRTRAQHDPVEPIVPNSVAGEACTSYDYTAYSHVVPRAHLTTVMQREANRMGALRVSDAALALEQQEMIKERRAEIDDVSAMRLALHLRALLSPTHPYGRPVLGRPDDVARLTTQDVATFRHTWYSPNNTALQNCSCDRTSFGGSASTRSSLSTFGTGSLPGKWSIKRMIMPQ